MTYLFNTQKYLKKLLSFKFIVQGLTGGRSWQKQSPQSRPFHPRSEVPPISPQGSQKKIKKKYIFYYFFNISFTSTLVYYLKQLYINIAKDTSCKLNICQHLNTNLQSFIKFNLKNQSTRRSHFSLFWLEREVTSPCFGKPDQSLIMRVSRDGRQECPPPMFLAHLVTQ